MAKITKGYSLEEENTLWLKRKAKQLDRSASWFLNGLLGDLREKEGNNCETDDASKGLGVDNG